MVGPMQKSLFGFCFQLFLVFVSITQFSDFWVMSYGNWKHILGVFSFHNLVSNDIFVIKHTFMGPTARDKSLQVYLFLLLSYSFFFTDSLQWPFFSSSSFFFFLFFFFTETPNILYQKKKKTHGYQFLKSSKNVFIFW